jgi:predicted metal-dependent phosphotriesterase family hydrolase
LVAAGAQAAVQTGVPVAVHTEVGTVDVLGREVVPRLRRRIGDDGVTTVLRRAPQALLARTA